MSHEDRIGISEQAHRRQEIYSWIQGLADTEDLVERTDTLLTFLSGEHPTYKNNFPQIGDQDHEPAIEILRGLAGMRILTNQGEIIARTNASVINLQPDVVPISENPQRLLYNVINLARGNPAARDGYVVDAIEGMYRSGKLTGSYNGHDLGDIFIEALKIHQPDTRHKQMWEDVLDQRGDSFIPITPESAFDGLVMVAGSKETLGSPHLETLGPAFSKFAEYVKNNFESEEIWREKFAWAVDRALRTYPGRPEWPKEFGAFAITGRDWEPWMIESADLMLVQNTRQHIAFPSKKRRNYRKMAT
jgi:hypothetical protein